MNVNHLLIALIVLLYSCNQSSSRNSDSSESSTLSNPESVGMISDSLDNIEKHVQWAIDSQFISGGVALVARNDEIIYHKAIGYSDREKSEKLTTDHIFRMASMTKPVTTVAVMQLYEQGKINLDDPVSKYIPEFANPRVIENFNEQDSSYTTRPAEQEITIHHLLTHTSGLAYGWEPIAGPINAEFGIVEGWTKDSVLLEDNARKMGALPLLHDPGTKWTYGTSIDVLGRVVEIVSGLPLDQYFAQNIFEPLNMNDTYFYLPGEKSDRLVEVWFTSGIDVNNLPDFISGDYPISGHQTYFPGGAGLSSTSMDYYQFASALINKGEWNGSRILKEETVELMMSNQIDNLFINDEAQFGYGGSVHTNSGTYGRITGRFGWSGFWQTVYWIDPQRDIIGILLTNAINTPKWDELLGGYEGIVNRSVADPTIN